MERILLSTFFIKIFDHRSNIQILSRFNGTQDFYESFKVYMNGISGHTERFAYGRGHLFLRGDGVPFFDDTERIIYGYFKNGINGETYNIEDLASSTNLLDVHQQEHAAFRKLFFLIKIPRENNIGYLILQRKSKYGIKGLVTKSTNKFLNENGFPNYRIEINNAIHYSVFRQMLDQGQLKKVDLIKRRIPSSIEDAYTNGMETIPGVLKTSIVSASGLPDSYKEVVDRLFSSPENNIQTIEIPGIDDEFDEVEFQLELNGKKKTFFIASKSRIQPDIDVTNAMDPFVAEPSIDSLKREAIDQIRTIEEDFNNLIR